MEKLLNDQMFDMNTSVMEEQQIDLLVTSREVFQEKESEIGNGNLQDYLDVYGDLEDMY